MEIVFMVGRVLLGGFFLMQAYNHFKNQTGLSHYAKAKGIPMPSIAVFVSGVFLLLGGLSIVVGFEMILGMILLVLFLIPTTFMMHGFWKETDPQVRASEQIQFSKNLALMGALLMMVALTSVLF